MELGFENSQATVELDETGSAEAILDLYSKLESHYVDNFELVGMEPTATASEIQDAYDDFVATHHPDLFDTKSYSDFAQIANYVFDEISFVFGMLIHEAYRRESGGKN